MLERRSAYRGFFVQPGRCVQCEKAVTLHVLAPPLPTVARPIVWVCPVCSSLNHAEITGRLAMVSRGHPDPDPDWTPDRSDN